MAFVYLLCDSGHDNVFKIGMTRGKIENRIKELQTGNGDEIFISGYYETKNPAVIEKLMHTKYFGDRKMNEWFYLQSEDVVNFEENCRKMEENILKCAEDNVFLKDKLKN